MNSLQEYGELFYKLDLTELTVVEGDRKLCLKRDRVQSPGIQSPERSGEPLAATPDSAVPASPAVDPFAEALKAPEPEQGLTVKAPLLGIFTPSVKEGDIVKKGDALGMIEAMKMMNEILSPADGTVLKVLSEGGELVEFDQKLFVIS